MFFSVDRFENQRAVLVGEDKKPLDVPREMLPPGTKEGDVVEYHEGLFHPAPEQTEQRRQQVAEMLRRLLKQDDA